MMKPWMQTGDCFRIEVRTVKENNVVMLRIVRLKPREEGLFEFTWPKRSAEAFARAILRAAKG